MGIAIRRLLLLVLVLYGLLLAVHLLNTGSLSASLRMTGTDFNLAVKCPDQPGTLLSFLGRAEIWEREIQNRELRGQDMLPNICENGWPPSKG